LFISADAAKEIKRKKALLPAGVSKFAAHTVLIVSSLQKSKNLCKLHKYYTIITIACTCQQKAISEEQIFAFWFSPML
jgi:hypothetical protein